MTLGTIQSHHRSAPVEPRPGGARGGAPPAPFDATGAAQQGSFGPALPGGASGAGATAASTAAVTPTNPLRKMTSDIQAMLIQAQAAASSAAGKGAHASGGAAQSGAAQSATEQKLAADIDTLKSNLQASGASGVRTASTHPTDSVDHHHQHHHHGGDGGRNGASAATATAAASTGAGAAVSGTGAVSQFIAANVARALRAYGGGVAAAATPASAG